MKRFVRGHPEPNPWSLGLVSDEQISGAGRRPSCLGVVGGYTEGPSVFLSRFVNPSMRVSVNTRMTTRFDVLGKGMSLKRKRGGFQPGNMHGCNTETPVTGKKKKKKRKRDSSCPER